jgi:hypothetical protein
VNVKTVNANVMPTFEVDVEAVSAWMHIESDDGEIWKSDAAVGLPSELFSDWCRHAVTVGLS